MPTSGPKSISSFQAGLRASGKSSTRTIRPTRMSIFWKSSKVASGLGLGAQVGLAGHGGGLRLGRRRLRLAGRRGRGGHLGIRIVLGLDGRSARLVGSGLVGGLELALGG